MRLPNNTATLCVNGGVRFLIDAQGAAFAWAPESDPLPIYWSPALIKKTMEFNQWRYTDLAEICGVSLGGAKQWTKPEPTAISKPCRKLIWCKLKMECRPQTP